MSSTGLKQVTTKRVGGNGHVAYGKAETAKHFVAAYRHQPPS